MKLDVSFEYCSRKIFPVNIIQNNNGTVLPLCAIECYECIKLKAELIRNIRKRYSQLKCVAKTYAMFIVSVCNLSIGNRNGKKAGRFQIMNSYVPPKLI